MPANAMAKLCFNYDNLQKMNCFRLERYGSCISSWRHTVRSNFYSICCSNVFGIYNWLWFIMRSWNLELAVTTKQIPFEIEIVWKKRRKVISNEWCKVIGLSHVKCMNIYQLRPKYIWMWHQHLIDPRTEVNVMFCCLFKLILIYLFLLRSSHKQHLTVPNRNSDGWIWIKKKTDYCLKRFVLPYQSILVPFLSTQKYP